MTDARVSIITVCKNAGDTIGNTLQSVAGQTYEHIQHIVVDGASHDDTLDVVERFGAHLDQVISERDAGIYDALNKGMNLADGDLVGLLHADDFYPRSDVIEKVVAAQRSSRSDCVYGDLLYVDRRDTSRVVRRWHAGETSRCRLETGWVPPHPSFFATRPVCDAIGPYDTGLKFAADYDWMLTALLDLQVSATYLPRTLVHMRTGGTSNRSLQHRLEAHSEDRLVMRRHGTVLPVVPPLLKPLRKVPQFVASLRRGD